MIRATGSTGRADAAKRLLSIAWPALLIAVVLAAPWLSSPMFLDDWHNLVGARDAAWSPSGLAGGFSFLDYRELATWNLPGATGYHFFRPLLVASYKLDLSWWGPGGFGFHLTSLVIHLGCVLLFTGLVMRLTGDRRLARLAAIFWVVNPQVAVAVIWTSGRTELWVTLWVLAGLWCYVVARQDRRPLLLFWVILFQLLAFLSKESGVVLSLCLAAYEITLARAAATDRRAWLARAIAYLAPIALITLGYLAFRFLVFDSGPTPGRPYFNTPTQLGFVSFAAAKIIYYLFSVITGALIVPLFGVELLRAHPAALLGALALTGGLYYWIFRKARRGPVYQFFWLLLLGSLLPTLPTLATDLYLYFGAAAIGVILASCFVPAAESSTADDSPPTTEPAAGPPPSARWWRRPALLAYLAFFALGNLGRGVFYRAHGLASERTYDDVMADAPNGLPEGARLYLVNMPLVSAHIAPMVQVRQGLDDVHAVLVTVSTAWVEHRDRVRVECVSPTHVRLRPPSGRDAFFDTREEWYLQQLERPFDPHRGYRTVGATVHPVTDGDRIVALDLFLDGPSTGERYRIYSFFDDGTRLAHRVCGPSDLPAATP